MNRIFKVFGLFLVSILFFTSCVTSSDMQTVSNVDIQKFMGQWYVLGGRFTMLEVDVHNAVETYTWNEKENRIDIAFTYNKGSLDGPIKSIPQKGWIENPKTNAHWKVSPIWPLKFDYLIVDLDPNYNWTAIGVPSQKYLWIMARNWHNPEKTINEVVSRLKIKGYDTENVILVPHNK